MQRADGARRCAGKGGKNRSRAKSDRDGKRELHFKNVDEGQEYAQVLRMHGGPWLEAYCFDGVKRMCHICGKMGRKVRIAVGDIVLISLRGFQVSRQQRARGPAPRGADSRGHTPVGGASRGSARGAAHGRQAIMGSGGCAGVQGRQLNAFKFNAQLSQLRAERGIRGPLRSSVNAAANRLQDCAGRLHESHRESGLAMACPK